jgi:hypothetical protein
MMTAPLLFSPSATQAPSTLATLQALRKVLRNRRDQFGSIILYLEEQLSDPSPCRLRNEWTLELATSKASHAAFQIALDDVEVHIDALLKEAS